MSATNINVKGLIRSEVAISPDDSMPSFEALLLATEMDRIFEKQGSVEVVLTGLSYFNQSFLDHTWGRFLLWSKSLSEAERRHANTIFIYENGCPVLTRDLRFLINNIARKSLHHVEQRHFITTR